MKLYIAEAHARFEHGVVVVRAESKEQALEMLKKTEARWLYDIDDIEEHPLTGDAGVLFEHYREFGP